MRQINRDLSVLDEDLSVLDEDLSVLDEAGQEEPGELPAELAPIRDLVADALSGDAGGTLSNA